MVAALLQKPIGSALSWKRRANMEYFAGLDVSMAETQVCVMGRNGAVIHKATVYARRGQLAQSRPFPFGRAVCIRWNLGQRSPCPRVLPSFGQHDAQWPRSWPIRTLCQ